MPAESTRVIAAGNCGKKTTEVSKRKENNEISVIKHTVDGET